MKYLLLSLLTLISFCLGAQSPEENFRATVRITSVSNADQPEDSLFFVDLIANDLRGKPNVGDFLPGTVIFDRSCNISIVRQVLIPSSGSSGRLLMKVFSVDGQPPLQGGKGAAGMPGRNGLIGSIQEAGQRVNSCISWYNAGVDLIEIAIPDTLVGKQELTKVVRAEVDKKAGLDTTRIRTLEDTLTAQARALQQLRDEPVKRGSGLVGKGSDDDRLSVDFQEVASREFAQNMATFARQDAERKARDLVDSTVAALPPAKGRPADKLPAAIDSVIGTAWRAGGGIIGETVVSSLSDLKGAIAQGDTTFLVVDGFVYMPGAGENVVVPDGWKVRFTPGGIFKVDPGDTLTLPTDLDITGDRFVLRGEGRYILRGGFGRTSWFGAGERAGQVDEDYNVLSTDHTPFSHIYRKTLWSVGAAGQQNPTVIVSALGGRIQIGGDATEAVLTQYAPAGRRYKATASIIETWMRHEREGGGDTQYEIFDNVENVFERGLRLVAPNHSRFGAIDVGPYRDVGWQIGRDHASPYDTSGVRGDRHIDLLSVSDAARYARGMKVGIAIGASYFDQQQMTRAIVDSVVGRRLYLDRPILLDLQPSKGSTYGAVAENFTSPAYEETVQVRLTENVGHATTSLFSIGNMLYDRISNDGGGLYTIRNVHPTNPEGATILAGTRTGYQRTVFPMTLTPRGTIYSGEGDVVIVSRGDAFRISNVMDVHVENLNVYIARQEGTTGLAGNFDGYRNVRFKNVHIESLSARTEIIQYARGGEEFYAEELHTKGVTHEATEFVHDLYIRNSSFYVNEEAQPQKEGYGTPAVWHVGGTTGEIYFTDVDVTGIGVRALIGDQDIATYEATSGGRFVAKGLRLHGERVRTGLSIGVAGAKINAVGTGTVRDLIGRAGVGPRAQDGNLVTGHDRGSRSVFTRGGISEINLDFEGNFDRFVGSYSDAARINIRYTRTSSYDGTGIPTDFSQAYGTVWHRDGPDTEPYLLQANFEGSGFPLGFEQEIKFPGTLTGDSYIRLKSLRSPIYNQAETFKRIEADTTICVGGGCGQFQAPGVVQGVSQAELDFATDWVRNDILQAIDTLEIGGSRRYEIAPAAIAWQRKIDYVDTVRTRQLYRFHIDLKHTSDHIYAAPYHPSMVITDIDVDVQQDRTISQGTFYLARPGSLRLLTKVWDHSEQTIKGGHITITNMGNADLTTYPRERYYYDVVSQGPREVREQQFALVKENWNRFASAYQDSVIFGLTARPDVAPGPDAWLNTPSLDVDDSRFVEIEVEVLDYNAGDLSMTSVAVASGADLTGTIARERMFGIVEHTEGVYHVKIPEGLDRIGSIGFYYEGPGTQSSTTNARTMVRIISVKLVDRLADLNSGDTPNSIVLLRDFKRAPSGTTLDYAFLPIPFHQTLTMNEANGLTIRNLHLYDTKNRINNRGQSQHFFSAGSSQNVELTRAQIWGYHDRRLYKVEGGGTRYDVPMNVGDTVVYNVTDEGRNSTTARIWEEDRGPVYRVDVSNMEVGDTFRILSERDSSIIHEHIAEESGLQVVYYDRKDVLERMLWSATGPGQQQIVLKVYGHIRHVYGDEFQAGLIAGGGAKNWLMDYYHGEMMQGDGFQIQPGARNITIDHATLYGMGRMGWSANGGENVVVRNTDAFNAGRSTIDLEPYAFGWLLDGMRVDNVRVGGYNFNGWISANWSRIRDLHVDGFYDLGKGTLDSQGGNTWNGGAINSTFTNLYGYRFGFRGLNMTIDSISGTKLNIEAGESKPDDATGGRMIAGSVPSLMRKWELRPRYFSPNYQINIEGEGTIAVDGRIRADEFIGFESGTDYASLIRQDKGGKILSFQNDLYDLLFPAMVKGREAKPLKGIPDVTVEYNQTNLYDLPAGTYQISVGVVLGDSTEYVFPNTHTFVTDGNEGTIRIRPVDLFDETNGRIYYEWNIYVESSGHNTYEKLYRLRMNSDFAGIDETPGFDLYGDTLRVASTSDRALLYGYPTNAAGDVVVAATTWERAAGEYQAPGGVQMISFDDGVVRLSGGGGEFPLVITGGPGGPGGPSAAEGKQSKIFVDAAGRGDYTSIQAAMDSVARAAADSRVLPRIYIAPGNYVEALIAPCPGIQLFGIGASPDAVRVSAPTNRTSDNLVKSVYPSFRIENMTLYTDVEDSSLDFLSFTGADVDSIIIRDVVLITTGRVDLFVEATGKVYHSFLIDNMRTRGADGSGDNGGVTGREGMTVVNSFFEGENVIENNQGGKFENCFFGGKVDIKKGQFLSCTFGEATSSLYQGTIDGDATFDRCTFTRRSNGANCTLVKGGTPLFIDCKFMSTYEGGGSAARALDVTGGTPTLLGGQIVVVNDEGYAIGNSGGTLTAPRLLGTTIVGPIETTTVDVDESTYVVPGRNDMNIYPRPFPVTGQTEATYTTTLSGSGAYTVAAALDCVDGTPTGNETIQTYRTSDGNVAIKLGNLDPNNTYRPIIIGGTSSLD